MKRNIRLLLTALMVWLVLLVLLVAAETHAPGASIHSFWDAVWFSLITMTTVGYGDLSPVTPFGRVLGFIFALCSIGILTTLLSLGLRLISGQFLPRFRLRHSRGKTWYVFNEMNPDALTLARKLQEETPESLCIFPWQKDNPEQHPDSVLLNADCAALSSLRGTKEGIVFFGLSTDFWQNYTQGLAAAEAGIPAWCMTDVLLEGLPADLHLFSRSEIISRSYWQANPIRQSENRLVLIGCGAAGSALLERALLTNVFEPGRRLTYHVFGDTAGFRDLHPALIRALNPDGGDDVLLFCEGSWKGQQALLREADRIILCADDEQENLRVCSELRTWVPTAAAVHLLLKTQVPGLHTFGSRESILTTEFVMREKLNRLAFRTNTIYNKNSSNPVAWHDLSEFLRQSNIAAADHLPVKVRYLLNRDGLTAIGPNEYREAYLRYLSLAADHADLFREMEHRRWLRFYLMYNWEYAPRRDNALRRHPMMVPYRELSREEQEKDTYAWELLKRFAEGES